MNKGTFNLGKYDYVIIRVNSEDVLLCGTPLAFDDIIENAVSDIFFNLCKDFLNVDYPEYDYMDAIKQISEKIQDEFLKQNNLRLAYQETEF